MNATLKPYLYLAIVLAWVASLAAVGYWQNGAGHVAERSAWMERENDELRQANVEIIRLQAAARAQEQRQAELMATISITYQEQLTHETAQHRADIAALRAGALRLRDRAAIKNTDCHPVPETPAAAIGRDDLPGAELSGAASEFLLVLTSRADNLARQLAACQSVIRADRAQ